MLQLPSPPSPPPPPPPLSSDSHSTAPSLLIIVAIIAFVVTASASIHVLLRLISRYRSSSSSSSSSSSPPHPLLRSHSLEISDRNNLISSLPLFLFSSSSPKPQSLDCAVCLSNFRPRDELRLLPACRHAFHSQCIDTWLRSTPSCPLCRSSILLPSPSVNFSGSFRVELGSVRRSLDGIGSGHGRSYSLGSSFEYLVEGEEEVKVESSSFNSLRFSGRFGNLPTPAGGDRSCDVEAGGFGWEEESGFGLFYRWMVGV